MASGWVKSLQCKSRAFDDVFNPKKQLLPSSSCRKGSQSVKKATKPKHSHYHHQHHGHRQKPHKPRPKTEPASAPVSRPWPARNPEPLFPALTELPGGHPSRNVVEIIFHTSWSNKSFAGRIEVIFKVPNGCRTVSRFEEYRDMVKTRAGLSVGSSTWEENARCVADGNEMMRFHCLGPAAGVHDARGGAWVYPRGKGEAICTFSGSGGAHENGGGGRGRKAMLVCRVIAGQVSKQIGFESLLDERVGFDSVSGENGELLVFDPRAVLPCFLVIYKL